MLGGARHGGRVRQVEIRVAYPSESVSIITEFIAAPEMHKVVSVVACSPYVSS